MATPASASTPSARVVIAIPTSGRIHNLCVDSIYRMIRFTRRAAAIDLWWENAYPGGFCRNRLIRRFLADPQWTHLLFVDTDMVVPPDGLVGRLVMLSLQPR